MTLAARCPRCETVFRITGAQLSAAEGWVRCGVCEHLFDASQQLMPEPPVLKLDAPGQAAADAPQGLPVAASLPLADPSGPKAAPDDLRLQALPDIDLELPDLGALEPAATTSPEAASAAPPAVVNAEAEGPVASLPDDKPRDEPEPAFPPIYPDLRDGLRSDDRPASEAAAPSASESPVAPQAPSVAAPSAQTTSADRAGIGSWLLGLALLLLLATQAAYALRGHLAQLSPAWQEAVLEACARLGCTLPPVRSLQALSVDGSSLSFNAEDNTHKLKVLVRNASVSPVHLPAMELTLLDEQGQVLSRRALTPADLDRPLPAVGPASQEELTVTLDLAAVGASSIASFRIGLFYPEP